MISFWKISSMKLACFVLLAVTAVSIGWCLCYMVAGQHKTIALEVSERSTDWKLTPRVEERDNGHRKLLSDHVLWKIRMKEKWERQKKQMEESDNDNYTNGSFVKYVELSPGPSWDLDSLWDYFADTPSCAHSQGPFLLILITSTPGNFDRRMAIRNAWTKRTDFKSIFLVGRAPTEVLEIMVENEIGRHGDILRGNYNDSYRNLTLKVLHGLTFASRGCKPKYVLKTDDDCFVNVPLILNFLERHNRRKKALYVGNVLSHSRTKVIRNPGNKWHVPLSLYPSQFYPPYPSGHGYIISGDLLETLLNASSRLLPFPNEDAYIGVLMNAIGVHPITTHRFTLHNFHWRVCNLLYLMIIHDTGPEEQGPLADKAQKAKQLCPGQAEVTDW